MLRLIQTKFNNYNLSGTLLRVYIFYKTSIEMSKIKYIFIRKNYRKI